MAISSLKSRYIISAALLIILIVVVLLWASTNVRQSSDQSLDNVSNRRLIQLSSAHIRDNIWQTDFYINAYLLTPSADNRQRMLSSLAELERNIATLGNNHWSSKGGRENLIRKLDENVELMRGIIISLIDIRENQEKRFPSLSIIHNQLYPANLEFLTLSSLILEEIPIAQMSASDAEFYRLISDTQHVWQRMISSFRLFVAYRSETISNPQEGMNKELNDIKTLHDGVMSNLQQLKMPKRPDLPGLQDNETIDKMIRIAEDWYRNFESVSQIHISGAWRKDDAIIRERLHPLSQEIRQLLYKLDDEIDESIKADVQSLTALAGSIIGQIWLLGGIILVFIITGYFYIRNRVLEPISDVANGLLIKTTRHDIQQLPVSNTREVNALVTAFNQLSESLAKAEAVVRHTDKMSIVGELASGVAHEINNPLNNMARLTEFIEEEVTSAHGDERIRDDFRILHHEMDRCAAIVKNLLDFGKPGAPQVSSIDLNSIIHESIKLLKHQAQDKGLVINQDIGENLPRVNADPSQIHQVIVNLLLNAIHFSPEHEAITITLDVNDDQLQLICRIIDHGPGADQHEIERFFEPFYTTRKGQEGSGLGLSVCYSIIQHHNGQIGAHAGEHDGLIVWFTLPISSSEEE